MSTKGFSRVRVPQSLRIARGCFKETGLMDNHHSGPVETGASMDYAEHEKTYDMFIAGAKWGTMIIVVLMIAMAAGFFGGAGFIGSLILFIVLTVAGAFLLR
ncbi:aa3 type cytochrome c oxidase subunit IV [Xaviernesmea oryzae]|uniref:Aa3 type cytochrome c oxidase subunit IV n=2 Tax=Rhizobiaceae TaxID=82115 RepID=A0A1X7D0W5_9HYPH|nr:aa3 type cytochrome c oxidase subunit IV [Xaviernesmea oryzae]